MTQNPPASFRQCCTCDVSDGIVTVTCNLRDTRTGEVFSIEESVDTLPIAEEIAGALAIGGIGDYLSKAASAAKKVASSKAIKAVWSKASPIVKELAKEVPGGSAAMALAMKTADTVAAARKGDKAAIKALKNTALKAAQGHPLAKEVMKTAKVLGRMQSAKEGKDPTDLAKRMALIERTLNPLLGNPQSGYKVGAVRPGYLTPKMQAKLKAKLDAKRKRNKPAIARKAAVPSPRIAPRSEEELYEMAEEMYQDGYASEEIQEEISGWREWMFHRPYRTAAAAALSGDIGASLTLRSLYTNGLQNIASLRR